MSAFLFTLFIFVRNLVVLSVGIGLIGTGFRNQSGAWQKIFAVVIGLFLTYLGLRWFWFMFF